MGTDGRYGFQTSCAIQIFEDPVYEMNNFANCGGVFYFLLVSLCSELVLVDELGLFDIKRMVCVDWRLIMLPKL